MSNGLDALPTTTPAAHLRRLVDLPALRLADQERDVRGWQVRSSDGEVLGVVIDLLADQDRLLAEFLVVEEPAPGAAQWIVPVNKMEVRASHLVPGTGFPPIALRYQSTVRLTLWTAAIAAVAILLVWLISLVAF